MHDGQERTFYVLPYEGQIYLGCDGGNVGKSLRSIGGSMIRQIITIDCATAGNHSSSITFGHWAARRRADAEIPGKTSAALAGIALDMADNFRRGVDCACAGSDGPYSEPKQMAFISHPHMEDGR